MSLLPIFEAYVAGLKTEPKNLCRSCGTNLDFNQCFCNSTTTQPIQANSVAITKDADGSQRLVVSMACELGEHCRCKSFDVACKADCWNWIGKVTV
jgi:hypothetical protein